MLLLSCTNRVENTQLDENVVCYSYYKNESRLVLQNYWFLNSKINAYYTRNVTNTGIKCKITQESTLNDVIFNLDVETEKFLSIHLYDTMKRPQNPNLPILFIVEKNSKPLNFNKREIHTNLVLNDHMYEHVYNQKKFSYKVVLNKKKLIEQFEINNGDELKITIMLSSGSIYEYPSMETRKMLQSLISNEAPLELFFKSEPQIIKF